MQATLYNLMFFSFAVLLSASVASAWLAQSTAGMCGNASNSAGAIVRGDSVVTATNYLSSFASARSAGIFDSALNYNISSTQSLVKLDHAVVNTNYISARYLYVQENFHRRFNAPLGSLT